MAAKLVELIEATERRGNGTEADPVRVVTGWWTKAGELVVEDDKWPAEATKKKLETRVKILADMLLRELAKPEAAQRAVAAKRNKKGKPAPLKDLGVMTRTKVRQKLERLQAERQRRKGGAK